MTKEKGKDRRTQAETNAYRRQALMEGTVRLLADQGVTAATVRAISAMTTGSRGLLNHYYESKEELLAEAFRHLTDTVNDSIERRLDRCDDDPFIRLKAFPRAMFSREVFSKINRNAYLTFWHEIRFNETVRRTNRKLYNRYVGVVEDLFRASAEQKGDEINWRLSARGLIALMDGLWLQISIDERPGATSEALEICDRFIEQQFSRS